jgi:hypothetical protein
MGLRRTEQHLPQRDVEPTRMSSLTPAEDEELRRLAALAQYGALTPAMAEIYDELRARDRRATVREPRVLAVPYPRADADGPVTAGC